jgi:hypothetical protein
MEFLLLLHSQHQYLQRVEVVEVVMITLVVMPVVLVVEHLRVIMHHQRLEEQEQTIQVQHSKDFLVVP